jgi:hypothetical protein
MMAIFVVFLVLMMIVVGVALSILFNKKDK